VIKSCTFAVILYISISAVFIRIIEKRQNVLSFPIWYKEENIKNKNIKTENQKRRIKINKMFGAGCKCKRFPFVFIFPGFAQVPEHGELGECAKSAP